MVSVLPTFLSGSTFNLISQYVCVFVWKSVCVHVFDRQLLRFYVWVTFQDDLDRTLHTLCWCVVLALSDSSHPYSSSAHVGSQGIIRRVFHLT